MSQTQINQANGRLKAGKIGVTIEAIAASSICIILAYFILQHEL